MKYVATIVCKGLIQKKCKNNNAESSRFTSFDNRFTTCPTVVPLKDVLLNRKPCVINKICIFKHFIWSETSFGVLKNDLPSRQILLSRNQSKLAIIYVIYFVKSLCPTSLRGTSTNPPKPGPSGGRPTLRLRLQHHSRTVPLRLLLQENLYFKLGSITIANLFYPKYLFMVFWILLNKFQNLMEIIFVGKINLTFPLLSSHTSVQNIIEAFLWD